MIFGDSANTLFQKYPKYYRQGKSLAWQNFLRVLLVLFLSWPFKIVVLLIIFFYSSTFENCSALPSIIANSLGEFLQGMAAFEV